MRKKLRVVFKLLDDAQPLIELEEGRDAAYALALSVKLRQDKAIAATKIRNARELELPEEDAGHSLVPVLPGVHEHVRMAAMQGWQERCRLDQLRACPDDADDPQLVGSLAGASG